MTGSDETQWIAVAPGRMPTAFATSSGEASPVLDGCAEYDAAPCPSQQVVPQRAPREGMHPWAADHSDPTLGVRHGVAGEQGSDVAPGTARRARLLKHKAGSGRNAYLTKSCVQLGARF